MNDLLDSIKKDTKKTLRNLNVDGGATENEFLLQFQSDISNITITRPSNIESTAIGSAILAGVKNSEGVLLGLVALEDVIEELVGEIEDESDLATK